jgi:hypothetical protein
MTRTNLLWFVGGAIAIVALFGLGGLVFLKIGANGFSARGGSEAGEMDSWKLVHFIRHLPELSPSEVAEMEKLNPKGPEDKEQEKQEEQFLNGQTPAEAPKEHKH